MNELTPERLSEITSDILWALRREAIASCDCNAKSPDPDVHAQNCDYKHIKLAEHGLAQLIGQLSAAQKRIELLEKANRVLAKLDSTPPQ